MSVSRASHPKGRPPRLRIARLGVIEMSACVQQQPGDLCSTLQENFSSNKRSDLPQPCHSERASAREEILKLLTSKPRAESATSHPNYPTRLGSEGLARFYSTAPIYSCHKQIISPYHQIRHLTILLFTNVINFAKVFLENSREMIWAQTRKEVLSNDNSIPNC